MVWWEDEGNARHDEKMKEMHVMMAR